MNISAEWQIASLRFAIVSISFLLIFGLWKELKTWRWIFLLLVPDSVNAIMSTPVITTGGWIYSAPDREEVALHLILFWVFGFVFFIIWFLSKKFIQEKLIRNNFFIWSLVVLIAIVVVYVLGEQNTNFVQVLSIHGTLLQILYSSFFIGGIIFFLVLEFIYISFLRIRSLGYSKYLVAVLIAPVYILLAPDFGVTFFVAIGAPIYLTTMVLLYALPKKFHSYITEYQERIFTKLRFFKKTYILWGLWLTYMIIILFPHFSNFIWFLIENNN